MAELFAAFFDSWGLFGTTYLTGWLAGVLLATVGVLVVAQRQELLGLAISQTSTLGVAVATVAGALTPSVDHHELHGMPVVLACLFGMLASWATSSGSRRGVPPAAVAAWLWVVGSAGTVLLLAHSPHGTEEVEQLMFSSLIGADRHDVTVFALAATTALGVANWQRRALLLVATDPVTAHAIGLPTRWIRRATAWSIGLAIGLALHATGVLYTFGSLVLPALAARHLCRRMGSLFVVAPALALACSAAGFVLANGYDLPPAQVAVACQGAMLAVCWLGARLRG